jgi:hypothetical protein
MSNIEPINRYPEPEDLPHGDDSELEDVSQTGDSSENPSPPVPSFEDGTPYPPTWVESGGREVPYDVMTKEEKRAYIAHRVGMMQRRSASWDMPLWKGVRYDYEVAKRNLKESGTIGNRLWAAAWLARRHVDQHPEGWIASADKSMSEVAAFYGDEEKGTKRKAITVAVGAAAIGLTAYAAYKTGSSMPLPGHLGLSLPVDSNIHVADVVTPDILPAPNGGGLDVYLAHNDNPWDAITRQLGGRLDHLTHDQTTRVVDFLKDYAVGHDLRGYDTTRLPHGSHFTIPEAAIRAALEQYAK